MNLRSAIWKHRLAFRFTLCAAAALLGVAIGNTTSQKLTYAAIFCGIGAYLSWAISSVAGPPQLDVRIPELEQMRKEREAYANAQALHELKLNVLVGMTLLAWFGVLYLWTPAAAAVMVAFLGYFTGRTPGGIPFWLFFLPLVVWAGHSNGGWRLGSAAGLVMLIGFLVGILEKLEEADRLKGVPE